jgi:hypothetical protein
MRGKSTPVRNYEPVLDANRDQRRNDFLQAGQTERRRLVEERRGLERTRNVTFAPESLALKEGWEDCERLSDSRFNPLGLYITELFAQHVQSGTNRMLNGPDWRDVVRKLPGMEGKTIRWDADKKVYCVRDISFVKTEDASEALLNGYCDVVISVLAGFERSSYGAQDEGEKEDNANFFDSGNYSAMQGILKTSEMFWLLMVYAAEMRRKLVALGTDPDQCGFELDKIPVELRAVCIMKKVDAFGDSLVNAAPATM